MDLLRSFGVTDIFGHLNVSRFATRKEVKDAYKSMARTLHPDKTNGRTEVEFKVLALCYKECLKNVVEGEPVPTHEELKTAERPEVAYERSFYRTNFDDPKTREEIFADDDLDYERFEQAMKKTQSGSTSYVADNLYNKNIYEKLKTNGKFDKEKFNAYFLKLKKDGKLGKEMVVKQKVVPYTNSSFMEVNMHDDMIINLDPEKRKGNFIDLMKNDEIKSADMNELLSLDEVKLKKLLAESKINTGKLSKKKIRESINSRANLKVDTSCSFNEGISRLEQDAANRIIMEREKQKSVVEKYKHTLSLTASPPSRS